MDILRLIHGEVRWLVVLVIAIALIRFAIGWFGNRAYQPMDRGLMAAVTGLLDLNVTLGIILLLILGVSENAWPAVRLEHGLTMILATAVAHSSVRWRNAEDDQRKFRNNFLVVLIVLLLVILGVWRIGGWS